MAKDFSTMEDSNPSSNPEIHSLSHPARRTVLRIGTGAAVSALLAPLLGGCHALSPTGVAPPASPRIGFKSIPIDTADSSTKCVSQ